MTAAETNSGDRRSGGCASNVTQNPFGANALRYFDLGWEVLPLPAFGKKVVFKGLTGTDGEPLRRDEVEHLSAGAGVRYYRPGHADGPWFDLWWRPGMNIALRMPVGVIGLDVDQYADKNGLETVRELETRHGPLPTTCVVTSRGGDRASGIRLFQVVPGYKFRDQKGVEMIQRHHRVVVAPPSVHPEGRVYQAYRSDDWSPMPLCGPRQLPWLPERWQVALAAGRAPERGDAQELSVVESRAWAAEHVAGDGTWGVRDAEDAYATAYAEKGSRNSALYQAMLTAARAVRAGRCAAGTAFDAVWAAHVVRCDGVRPPRQDELERAVGRAIAKTEPVRFVQFGGTPHD